MPTLRKRSRTLETPANPSYNNQINNGEFVTQSEKTVSGYEESREKRIRENLERMQKLGIMDLSLKLKSCNPSNKRNYSVKKTPNGHSPLQPLGPSRRSTRLQNVTPVSYVEVHKANKEGRMQDEDILLEEGLRPEIYTEKHEKLLGDCKMSWTLFVDGCGKDGKRVYDSYKGKTCHQCRQKTLGHRTHCSQCNMVQGQFCGDCLYMRYGENVLEAKQNPNWICPPCRGICNCSLCRKAKGWAPTGYLYRKVSNLGYKSVAHYLIETRRRSPEDSGSNSGTKTPLSAKRSLPFSDMEAPPAEVNDVHLGLSKPQSEDKRDIEFKVKDNKEMLFLDNGDGNIAPGNSQKNKESPSAIEPSLDTIARRLRQRHTKDKDNEREELKGKTLAVKQAANNISAGASVSEKGSDLSTAKVNYDHLGLSKPQSEDGRDDATNGEEDDGMHTLYNSDIKIELESRSRKLKPTSALEPSPDSIGGRLRQRRKEEKSHECEEEEDAINEDEEEDAINVEEEEEDAINGEEDDALHSLHKSDIKIELESSSRKQNPTSALKPSPDSIGGRLRQRRKEEKNHEGEEEANAINGEKDDGTLILCDSDIKIELESRSRKQKRTFALELSPDSVGGRLRQRRKEEKIHEGKEVVVFTEETMVA